MVVFDGGGLRRSERRATDGGCRTSRDKKLHDLMVFDVADSLSTPLVSSSESRESTMALAIKDKVTYRAKWSCLMEVD